MKNLVDKKAYRTFITTCFDLNTNASMLNTLELQRQSLDNARTNTPPTSSLPPTPHTTSNQESASSANLSPGHMSLIIAAGFNKGEIHVFDGFKKEASVFYNNNRLIEKTKVKIMNTPQTESKGKEHHWTLSMTKPPIELTILIEPNTVQLFFPFFLLSLQVEKTFGFFHFCKELGTQQEFFPKCSLLLSFGEFLTLDFALSLCNF